MAKTDEDTFYDHETQRSLHIITICIWNKVKFHYFELMTETYDLWKNTFKIFFFF